MLVSGYVLARIFAWPTTMAPAVGVHQQIALLGLSGGQLAVVIYRFTTPADRLPRSFFNAGKLQSLMAAPLAGCPTNLRELMFHRTADAKTGTSFTRLSVARLPGVKSETISAHLDDSLACYLAAPGSFAAGGPQ